MHLQPDMSTALKQAGHDMPPPPQSGIGKDPRPKFEDLHWTKEEREGHQAYIDNTQKGSSKREEEEAEEPRRSVSELKDFWTNKERVESPKRTSASNPKVSPMGNRQRTGVGEMASQSSNKNQVVDSKNTESSVKSAEENDEEESRRVSVHDMANFWAEKEREQASEAARSKGWKGRKSAISDRVEASKEPAHKQVMATSTGKEDRCPPPSQLISERVKALNEAPKEATEKSLHEEDINPPPSAPIAEYVKTFEEGPTDSKKEIAETKIRLDKTTDMSTANRLTTLEEKVTQGQEESRQALPADLGEEAAQKEQKGSDPEKLQTDPNEPGPKLEHLTKNRAEPPAKKTKPSGPET